MWNGSEETAEEEQWERKKGEIWNWEQWKNGVISHKIQWK